MLQPRLPRAPSAIEPSLSSLAACLNALSLCRHHARLQFPFAPVFVRHASHAQQGRANGPKDSAGRRLGAKKSASEYVIPGNIIFKQRGTLWFPGENTDIGKDHTIYATEAGYVRYYQDPLRHPKRRYIGVALERDGPMSKLPTPVNAPTRRRLGMYAAPIKDSAQSSKTFLEAHLSANSTDAPIPAATANTATSPTPPTLTPKPSTPSVFRPGTVRESNYSLGFAAEKKDIKVRQYDRKDRWLAWRKRGSKVRKGMLARAAKATRGNKGKKANKGVAPNKGPARSRGPVKK